MSQIWSAIGTFRRRMERWPDITGHRRQRHHSPAAATVADSKRGVRIFAFLGSRAVGDFVTENCFAASLKMSLENATLTVYYRDDRPYKRQVVAMNPHIDDVVVSRPWGASLPLDYFDTAWQPPIRHPAPFWSEEGVGDVDFLLTPSMVAFPLMGAFPVRARFRIPVRMEQTLEEQLAALGLPARRWFACVHTKERGYRFRPNTGCDRNVDPSRYFELCRHIIENQGGIAVRLGDPSMQPFPAIEGLVDLSRLTDRFDLHAYAISRSRYLVDADSGLFPLGSALGVPTAGTNLISDSMPWNEEDIILTKIVVAPNGTEFSQESARAAGLLREDISQLGYTVLDNSLDQLCRVADQLRDTTQDCPGWRVSSRETASSGRPGPSIAWPLTPVIKAVVW